MIFKASLFSNEIYPTKQAARQMKMCGVVDFPGIDVSPAMDWPTYRFRQQNSLPTGHIMSPLHTESLIDGSQKVDQKEKA